MYTRRQDIDKTISEQNKVSRHGDRLKMNSLGRAC